MMMGENAAPAVPGQPLQRAEQLAQKLASPARPQEDPERGKHGAGKEDHILSARPNLLLAALYLALNVVVITAIVLFSFFFIKFLFGIDVLQLVKEAILNLSAGTDNGEGFLLWMFFQEVEVTVLLGMIEAICVVFILNIPLINKRWRLKRDALQFSEGFILVRKDDIPLEDVTNVSYERYIQGMDFGKIVVEHSGGEGKEIEMPYIFNASQMTERINEQVKERHADIELQKMMEKEKGRQPQAAPGESPGF